jgi:hypothetical protein
LGGFQLSGLSGLNGCVHSIWATNGQALNFWPNNYFKNKKNKVGIKQFVVNNEINKLGIYSCQNKQD